ncbi:MAG: T9SS type A sorting domain-containing protein [Bacteroidia bacterium]
MDSQPWAQYYGTYIDAFEPSDSLRYEFTEFYNRSVIFSPGLGKQVLFEYGFEHADNFAITDYILSGDTTGRIYPESVFWPVGIDEEPGEKAISLFPNPIQSGQRLHIVFPEFADWTCRLRGIDGRLLASYAVAEKEIALPVPALPPGLYLLEIENGKGEVFREKILIE